MTVLAAPTPADLLFIPLIGLVVGLAVGLMVCVLWSPFLLSGRVRGCFAIGPTRWWQVNYVLAFVSLASLHATLAVAGLLFAGSPTGIFEALVGPALLVPAAGWTVAAFLLREREGRPDSPAFDGTTLGLLALGALWYAVLTGVPSFVIAVFANLPT